MYFTDLFGEINKTIKQQRTMLMIQDTRLEEQHQTFIPFNFKILNKVMTVF